MSTIVLNCSCQHEFQDKEYGKGRRLFSLKIKGGKAKCTVCGKEVNNK